MPDDITARSLTLVDAQGKPRIVMDAGGDDGIAHFSLISPSGERLSILAQPNGTVALSFDHPTRIGEVTLTKRGLVLRSADGKLAITVGDQLQQGLEQIIVYRDGQPIWQTPSAGSTSTV